MTLTYHDAFIPILNVSNKIKNCSVSNNFLSQKNNFQKQTCLNRSFKTRKTLLVMENYSTSKKIAIETIKKELNESKKDWKSSVRTLPSAYRKIISIFIFSSVVLSSWYLVPSKSRYISIAASVLSGGLAFFLTQKINSKNILGAQNKILDILYSETQPINFQKISKEIEAEFGINSNDLKYEILNIYKKYLLFFLQNFDIKFDEINELINLKNCLHISNQEIGECHIEIARDLYKEYTINLERKDSEYSNEKVNKFIFLSDRIFSTDSVKGYQYEISRLRKIFLFSYEKIQNICSSISYSLYSQIIDVSFKSGFYGLENLDNVKSTIGINTEQQNEIHTKFISGFVSNLLNKENKFTDEDIVKNQTLIKMLEMDESMFQKILFDLTKPIFYSELSNNLNKISSVMDKANLLTIAQSINLRKKELSIPSNEIKNLISSALRNETNAIMVSILNKMRIQKNEIMLNEIETLFIFNKNSFEIFNSCNLLTQQEIKEIYNNGAFYGIGKNFKSEDTKKLFEIFLQSCFKNLSINPELEEKIIQLKEILSISETEYKFLYNKITEPIYREEIVLAIEQKKCSKNDIKNIKNLQLSLKLTSDFTKIIKVKVYKSYLQNFTESNNILSLENSQKLNEIKKFLSLTWNDVQEIHDESNEPFYRKAISEAMGASGFISTNYWDSLEKLRKRLQMTEQKAKLIFYQVSKDKMRQLFDQAVIDYKRKLQIKNEGKESKEDIASANSGTALGIEAGNTSGSELSNLIDFYNRNKIFIEKESPLNISFNKNLNGLTGRSEVKKSMSIKTEYEYPVNINGLFDKKIVLEMYKQYLVDCFSSKLQNEKRKLFNNLDKLGPILGIESPEIKSIHTNVGSLVYKQFLAQALSKGYIDKSESTFLTTIQNTLSMDNSKCSELIKEAKKNRIAIFIESIFSTPKINPDRVSELRKMALYLGVDLQNDLSISGDQCAKLFRVEIDSNIEKGLITSDNQILVEEIRTAFGLSKEIVKKVLLETITTRCEGYLINAVASLRKNATDESLKEIKKMISFGNLLPIKIQSNFASKSEKEQLLSLFQSIETQTENTGLLKIMLNL
jgi:hypothetical protein